MRPLGSILLNFFGISGREFRSSAAKLRPKDNIGKLERMPVFVSALDAPVRRCAGKTSFLRCGKMCQDVPRCAKICQDMPKYAKIAFFSVNFLVPVLFT